jgi:hypothetical protein
MNGERRKHHRLAVRLPVLLSRPNGEPPTASETVNISSDGFYCTTSQPFIPGERLRCIISLRQGRQAEPYQYLDAEVEVVRIIAPQRESGFGIGCRIWDYRLMRVADTR